MSRARLFALVRPALASAIGVSTFVGLSAAFAAGPPRIAPSPFDYYVMALSWSPGFCDLGGNYRSPRQCEAGAGAGFVVHGLWPNDRSGPDPEDCGSGRLSSPELAAARDLYPSLGLARHEYLKHGSCTGLGARDYFAAVRYVRDQIAIPPMLRAPSERQRLSPRAIQQAFIDANANLGPTSIAVGCVRGELVDVRICLTRDLRAFANCPRVTARGCRSASIAVSPVR